MMPIVWMRLRRLGGKGELPILFNFTTSTLEPEAKSIHQVEGCFIVTACTMTEQKQQSRDMFLKLLRGEEAGLSHALTGR